MCCNSAGDSSRWMVQVRLGYLLTLCCKEWLCRKNLLTTSLENEKSPDAQDGLVLLHPISLIENTYKTAVCNLVLTPKHLGLIEKKPYFYRSVVKVGKGLVQKMQFVLTVL